MKTAVLEVAGGNWTVLQAVYGLDRKTHSRQTGKALLASYPTAEQVGFVDIQNNRLEMAGGEFCGNASAAAAVLLAAEFSKSTVRYQVSGFDGKVVADVTRFNDDRYSVRASFQGMRYTVATRRYKGRQVNLVDMKGIIHVLIKDVFPADYERIHRELVDDLGLRNHEAVGVIWYARQGEKTRIDPVVWVKKVDTLYYETACGSGAIAAALCTGCSTITQPTGENIYVHVDGERIVTVCGVVIVASDR